MLTPEGDIHPDLTSEPAGAPTGTAAGRSSDRDDLSFAAFYRDHFTRVVAYLLFQGAQPAVAADVAQEAMIAAYREWERIEKPAAWVRVAAHRGLIRYRSRLSMETERMASVAQPEILEAPSEDLIERHWILQQLRQLPPAQGAVLSLYYDGFSLSEIAEITGRPETTVRSNLRHARAALHRKHEDRTAFEDGSTSH